MAQIDNALEYFNDLGRGARFSAVKFEDVFNCLQVCAIRKGFSGEVLNELVTLWLKIKIPITKWSALGYCMIPEGKASNETVLAVVHWILNNHFLDENSFKVVSALNWLIGLHELNLMNVDVLDPYYDFFFFFLNNDKLLVMASKLVYSYTKSRDVTRTKVRSILNLIDTKKSPKQCNCLLALLSLFKSYRPECVPEDVPMISTSVAFPKPNKVLMERLEDAQIRSNVQLNQTSESRLTWWTGESATKNFRNQNIIHLLPDVDYLQLGSVIYMKDGETKKCHDFTSAHNLLVYHCGNRIMTPANILSLLVNDVGLHILQFSDRLSQSRLSQTLYHTLYNNFLRTKTNLTLVEKTHFLKRISVLQGRLQQGIPVVSRFLSQFIYSWNGFDYLNEILELLEWISFENFDELYDFILEPIDTLFMTNDVLYRCTLLDMLKKMYINIHKMMTPERKLIFLSRSRINDVDILNNFSDFFNELCEKSLNTLPDSIALKHCFLDIYEAIADLELQCDKPLWSVMPMSLAYGILCSHNAFSINRILGLFLKYQEIYEKIKQNYGTEDIECQITLMDSYSTDYANCLWYGRAITWSHQGFMMSKLPKKLLEQMDSNLTRYDRLLDIKHHIAFAPFMMEDMDDIDKELWLKMVISPNFDNIPRFFDTVLLKS